MAFAKEGLCLSQKVPAAPKSPFPPTRPRAELGAAGFRSFTRAPRAAGVPDKLPNVPAKFLKSHDGASMVGTGLKRFRRPESIGNLAKDQRPYGEALDLLAARALESP